MIYLYLFIAALLSWLLFGLFIKSSWRIVVCALFSSVLVQAVNFFWHGFMDSFWVYSLLVSVVVFLFYCFGFEVFTAAVFEKNVD